MATMPPITANAFRRDQCSVQNTMRAGVVPSCAQAADSHWGLWETFCESLGIGPIKLQLCNPVPLLQVFGACYRDGCLAPSSKPIRHCTV
jgi:hypothetical protein